MTCVAWIDDHDFKEELDLVAKDLNLQLVTKYPQSGSVISLNKSVRESAVLSNLSGLPS